MQSTSHEPRISLIYGILRLRPLELYAVIVRDLFIRGFYILVYTNRLSTANINTSYPTYSEKTV